MEKILKELGLPKEATDDDIIAAIKDLKSKTAGKKKSAAEEEREKLLNVKMAAGLSREMAMDAIKNQEEEDALKKDK